MRLLALDTSTMHASVAVVDGDRVLAAAEGGAQTHSEELLARIADVLAASGLRLGDLDGVALGAGPGSFTGLRIGFATAKGLCFAAGLPLYAPSSLAALALDLAGAAGELASGALLVPVLDARRGEIFAGFYRLAGDAVAAAAVERVLAPDSLAPLAAEARERTGCESAVLGGDGVRAYGEALSGVGTLVPGAPGSPSASAVGRLAGRGQPVASLAAAAPSYLRLAEVEVKYPHGNPGGPPKTKRS